MSTHDLRWWWGLAALLPLALLFARADPAEDGLPTATLRLGDHRLAVEIPVEELDLHRGLMYRENLYDDHGMLFVWPDAGERGMWMLNTSIPLDVAFIDEQYVITNIERMEPHTTEMHHAARPARYALEVNAGWFERHGIEAGDRIPDLERVLEGIE